MELNRRPPRYKRGALTTELLARVRTSIAHKFGLIKPLCCFFYLACYTGSRMRKERLERLRRLAKHRMRTSPDPVHDLAHVTRVVRMVHTLGTQSGLNRAQLQALELAAWWHDVSRTLTKRPSIMLMPFVDDLLSALMLWWATIRCGVFGAVPGMATRMIACKNIGTSRLLTRLFIRKQNRIMIDLLSDADALDMIDTERTSRLCTLAESSALYLIGYRMTAWWFFVRRKLAVKTSVAKRYLIKRIQAFLVWMQRADVRHWHNVHLGSKWVKRFEVLVPAYLQQLKVQ